MTTCVNQEKKGYAGKAVSATLAGVLAVGMVPAAAFAEAAGDEAAEDASVSLLTNATASDVQVVANSTISAAADQAGDVVSDITNVEIAKDTSKPQYVIPTEITSPTEGKITIKSDDIEEYNSSTPANNTTKYVFQLYKVTDSDSAVKTWSGTDKVKAITISDNADDLKTDGTFYVGIAATTGNTIDDKNFTVLKFSIVSKSLSGATVVGKDEDETALTFGTEFKLGDTLNVALNGSVIAAENLDLSTAKVYKADGVTEAGTFYSNSAAAAVTLDAGNYTLVISGKTGKDYAGSTVKIPFTVNKLDLSTAVIELTDAAGSSVIADDVAGTALPTAVKTIAGKNVSSGKLAGETINLSLGGGAVASDTSKGSYTYTVTGDSNSKNITGTGTVTVNRYEKTAHLFYGSETEWTSLTGQTTVFDSSKVVIKDSATYSTGKTLNLATTVTYTKDGKTVSEDVAKTVHGTYTATVKIADTTNTYGGSATYTYTISQTDVANTNVYAYYNGKLIKNASVKDVYTGSDLLPNFTFKVYDNNGKEISSSEYSVVVKAGSKKATEIKDVANNYTVAVEFNEDSNYKFSNSDTASVSVEVVQVNTDKDGNATVRLADEPTVGGQTSAYAYTGSAITPSFEYNVKTDDSTLATDYSKNKKYVALPTDSYKVTYYKAATADKSVAVTDDKLNSGYVQYGSKYYTTPSDLSSATKVESPTDAGAYVAVLTDNAKDGNFNVVANVPFVITDSKYFIDVPVGTWYYDNVYKANDLGYMTGYDGTKYFGPNDNLTRAQAVVVLYKMAYKTDAGEADAWNSTKYSYASQFADVDQSGWYAQALGWAVKAGIVTGTSDTTFEPNRDVTRQEFALMLQRYAKANAKDVTADTSVLKTYADANAVDSWATDGVAWAVDNKIMGQGVTVLNPTGTITRAEVATMAIRYQPERDTTL